jgi:uncharacterized protein (DUF58 family)
MRALLDQELDDPNEALAALRAVQIVTQKLASLELAGAYRSTFQGQGLEFREVRPYMPGDDVRTIDWNVSARMNEPFVKVFSEERELNVFLVLDTSASMNFGTQRTTKRRVSLEVCALLAMSAAVQGDRVGLLSGADSLEQMVAPKKGRKHAFRILTSAAALPKGSGSRRSSQTHLSPLLDALTSRRRGVAFVISDFFCGSFETSLSKAASKHDVVPVVIEDPRDQQLPNIGLVTFEDFETGELLTLDTASQTVRNNYSQAHTLALRTRSALFAKLGVESISIQTGASFIDPMRRFFKQRTRRRR